ncbi:MAG: methylenetetrahydrofolate reductase [Lachnospiraceae bacterium]|nr:methylenetetrahydrofolate reductase [NAD(P)H] [Lachnospiraceae bacterium]MBQ3967690.1 methylenetetrahydrofolate reductase [NAD(P)H] [Lachnospiraceae bacterium]MBR4586831.1 methylenetetrahydrofolate reductase [NAD(P)H] [Lachnospiraceae bacterium]
MKIRDIIRKDVPTLSMEVFPPKTDASIESVERAVDSILTLNPSWMSVTYGAGGGTSAHTARIASRIKEAGVPSLAHLSCISSTKDGVKKELTRLKELGIENILALRGDIPAGSENAPRDYKYASELVTEIKQFGDFCVGGACYPEGHPDAPNWKEDIRNLKTKVDAGCDFLTTQMFFDNETFYSFLYRCREAGINVPIVAGIMPITTELQVTRALKLSQAFMPAKFRSLVDRFGSDPAAMKQAGIIYAANQIVDLLSNGVMNIHIYTMNKPDVSSAIQSALRGLV